MSFFMPTKRGLEHVTQPIGDFTPIHNQPNRSHLPLSSLEGYPHQGMSALSTSTSFQTFSDDSMPQTLPKLGETRCYWSLLSSDLDFIYLDPAFASHLENQADLLIGKSLLFFVHPEEQATARADLAEALEQRTMHGNVPRVRYCRLARIRRILGHQGPSPSWPDGDKVSVDAYYTVVDIVINWAAEGLVLCFIHAVVDLEPGDNDENHRTPWTNWCGTPCMHPEQIALLQQRLLYYFPQSTTAHRVFQILLSSNYSQPECRLLLSWPPDNSQEYPGMAGPKEFARRAAGIQTSTRGNSAKTSCTRRWRIRDTMPGIGEVESVFIPHGSITFACHTIQQPASRSLSVPYSQSQPFTRSTDAYMPAHSQHHPYDLSASSYTLPPVSTTMPQSYGQQYTSSVTSQYSHSPWGSYSGTSSSLSQFNRWPTESHAHSLTSLSSNSCTIRESPYSSTQLQQQPFVQAQPNAGQDVLAVACVIDASLALATEWPRVVTQYIFPIIKRLNEAYSGHQFLLALVTYGEADMRPSPLLSKRFFYPVLLNSIIKDFCEDPKNLGIGTATGVRGLSALEGIVAAIEFFDILHNPLVITAKDNGALVSHILHVAASPPDSTQRPAWNALHHLGTVSWNTLPLELQKRNINLSLVALKQIPQFQDVQAAASASGTQCSPWFTVHASHILMLSGFPSMTPKHNASRRPNEASESPDTKRQNIVEKALPLLGPCAPGGAGAVGQRLPSIQPTPSQTLQTLVPHAAPVVPLYSYSKFHIPDLTALITRCSQDPVCGGTYGNIYKCKYNGPGGNVDVAVKAIRPQLPSAEVSAFRRELGIWKRLRHPSILNVMGITSNFGPSMALVSLWMDNGTLTSFLDQNRATLTLLNRLFLLYDIAAGLHYLHTFTLIGDGHEDLGVVVHGDLTGANVLVGSDRKAYLTDFGLSGILNKSTGMTYLMNMTCRPGALRWTAPELLSGEGLASANTQSDMYSFGSIMLQVLMGIVPWSHLRGEHAILLKVIEGQLHPRPDDDCVADKHWDFMTNCWSMSPVHRPSAEEALQFVVRELYYSSCIIARQKNF